jgi:GT2 family glycosyltransferase
MEKGLQNTNRVSVDIVFVVLVYKNASDLSDFLQSLSRLEHSSHRVVVVNSYFDDSTAKTIEQIARTGDCDFINVPNKGYGAGNNRGIEFAVNHYQFSFLIVSNPDIEVEHFDISSLDSFSSKPCLIAPQIIRNSGKNQNPPIVIRSRLAYWLEYLGFRMHLNLLVYAGVFVNHIYRFFLFHKKTRTIFECHGSFVIFTRSALEKMMPVYDEDIFMFYEEMDLGFRTKNLGISSYYLPEISVHHKEDGSIKLSNLNVFKASQKSYLYVYRKWNRKRRKA